MRHFWSRKMVSVNGNKPTRPLVRYTVPEEIAGMRKDVAQFTGQTIALLAGLAKEHLVWRPAIAFTLCG
jgi:hypothetical protein